MYINNKPFLHTKSSKLQFSSIQSTANRSANTIQKGLQTVINLYQKRGFNVSDIHADNEFNIASIHDELKPINFHIYSPEEHVHEIERANRTFKESCRVICHSLPFTKYPKIMQFFFSRIHNILDQCIPSQQWSLKHP